MCPSSALLRVTSSTLATGRAGDHAKAEVAAKAECEGEEAEHATCGGTCLGSWLLRRLRQKYCEFKASLGNSMRPCLKFVLFHFVLSGKIEP